jgi:hypothetical protein
MDGSEGTVAGDPPDGRSRARRPRNVGNHSRCGPPVPCKPRACRRAGRFSSICSHRSSSGGPVASWVGSHRSSGSLVGEAAARRHQRDAEGRPARARSLQRRARPQPRDACRGGRVRRRSPWT